MICGYLCIQFSCLTLPLQGTPANNNIRLISPETGVSMRYILPLTIYAWLCKFPITQFCLKARTRQPIRCRAQDRFQRKMVVQGHSRSSVIFNYRQFIFSRTWYKAVRCARYQRDAVVRVRVTPNVAAKAHPWHPTHRRSPGKAVVKGNRHQWQPQTDSCQQRRHGNAASAATPALSFMLDAAHNICGFNTNKFSWIISIEVDTPESASIQ